MQMRTSKPGAGNKYYITKSAGGYSNCIVGKPTDKQCNVLSNCVGYGEGRFNEIGGYGQNKYVLNCNAENFIEKAQAQGLTISQTPSVGAIMCWQKGGLGSSDGAGHVCIVERVNSSTSVYTSESAYNGSAFYNQTRTKGSGNWGAGSAYKFRGFIVNPSGGNPTVPTGNVGEPVKVDTTRDQIEVTVASKFLRTRKRPETNDHVITGFIVPTTKDTRYNILGEVDRTGEASNGYYWLLVGVDKDGNDIYIARGDKGTTAASSTWTKLHKAVEPVKPVLQIVTSGPMSAGDVKSTVEFINAKGVAATVTDVK